MILLLDKKVGSLKTYSIKRWLCPKWGDFVSRTLQIFITKQHIKQGNFFGFLMITNLNGGALFDFLIQISFYRNIIEFAALHYYVIYFKTLS